MRFFTKTLQSFALLIGSICALTAPVYGQGFDLVFDVTGESFSSSQLAVFDQVETLLESQILGYQPGPGVFLSGAVIDVNLIMLDGPVNAAAGTGLIAAQGGGVLNPAGGGFNIGGFDFFTQSLNPVVTEPNGVVSALPGIFTNGIVQFDTADINLLETSGNSLFDILYHETVHALGFGLLFDPNNLVDANGQYIGPFALSTFQNEFGVASSTIPTDGTNPLDVLHFDENSILGSDILSPVLPLGGTNTFSDTTIAVFEDLGYVTILSVPEPSSLLILASSGLLLLRRRRFA